ncbi:uncharacterized protein VTP21DRAFT_9285 [Calcarisporiella thermophila]|uniref:uncharacterized protein n=1 Tax=Calcarisporiella thermophila TaxID=911321 RepID=UPI0037425F76
MDPLSAFLDEHYSSGVNDDAKTPQLYDLSGPSSPEENSCDSPTSSGERPTANMTFQGFTMQSYEEENLFIEGAKLDAFSSLDERILYMECEDTRVKDEDIIGFGEDEDEEEEEFMDDGNGDGQGTQYLLSGFPSRVVHKGLITPPQQYEGLSIRVCNIPQTGARSRVETQIKLCLQLMDGDEKVVRTWSYVRLPYELVSKEKTRKTQKNVEITDLDEFTVLNLEVTVVCANDPNRRVIACTSCVKRERKRLQRKKDGKIKNGSIPSSPLSSPTTTTTTESDSSNNMKLSDEQLMLLEQNRIIIFNCPELVEFDSGDATIPARITCYCRHHNEKIGFLLVFCLRDRWGRTVAMGRSPPIMITDDHKSTKAKASRQRNQPDSLPSLSRELSKFSDMKSPQYSYRDALPISPLSPRSVLDEEHTTSPPSTHPGEAKTSPYSLAESASLSTPLPGSRRERRQSAQQQPLGRSVPYVTTVGESQNQPSQQKSQQTSPRQVLGQRRLSHRKQQVLSLQRRESAPEVTSLFNTQAQLDWRTTTRPVLRRVIPVEGPLFGGIEVSVLGTGFYEGLTVMFGDIPTLATQFWSSSALICVLPPSPTPGPVQVTFKESPVDEHEQEPVYFVYKDEKIDYHLMELALQCLNMKLTGDVESARDIALRIVNSAQAANQDNSSSGFPASGGDAVGRIQFSENAVLRVLAHAERGGRGGVDMSLRHAQTRHTMLHFAALLGYARLTHRLAELGCDLNACDRSGFTALHFAAWIGNVDVVRALLAHGARTDLRACGRSAVDLSRSRYFHEITRLLREGSLPALNWSLPEREYSPTELHEEQDEDGDDYQDMGETEDERMPRGEVVAEVNSIAPGAARATPIPPDGEDSATGYLRKKIQRFLTAAASVGNHDIPFLKSLPYPHVPHVAMPSLDVHEYMQYLRYLENFIPPKFRRVTPPAQDDIKYEWQEMGYRDAAPATAVPAPTGSMTGKDPLANMWNEGMPAQPVASKLDSSSPVAPIQHWYWSMIGYPAWLSASHPVAEATAAKAAAATTTLRKQMPSPLPSFVVKEDPLPTPPCSSNQRRPNYAAPPISHAPAMPGGTEIDDHERDKLGTAKRAPGILNDKKLLWLYVPVLMAVSLWLLLQFLKAHPRVSMWLVSLIPQANTGLV